jgi:hypothetical protein
LLLFCSLKTDAINKGEATDVVIIKGKHYFLSTEKVKNACTCSLENFVSACRHYKNNLNGKTWKFLLQLSWFGAQKFCHQGGWLLGSVTNATFEKEIASKWQDKICL